MEPGKYLRICFLVWLILPRLACALEVAGVPLEPVVSVNGQALALNGAGLRTKVFFKVYVGALYVRAKSTDAYALLDSRDPWRMRLQLLRDLDAETLLGALRDGFDANLTATEKLAQAGNIDQFSVIMRRIGNSKKGDVVILDFGNDRITVNVGGESRGTVEGQGFGRAILSIWLGEHPVDADLKKALLGG